MLTPPAGLPEDVLVSALARGWEVAVASMAYRAVGFGSHHWEITDAVAVSEFRRNHQESPDDDKSWDELRALVERVYA